MSAPAGGRRVETGPSDAARARTPYGADENRPGS
jgi:hypothetical protein